jgi:hypothetical protein
MPQATEKNDVFSLGQIFMDVFLCRDYNNLPNNVGTLEYNPNKNSDDSIVLDKHVLLLETTLKEQFQALPIIKLVKKMLNRDPKDRPFMKYCIKKFEEVRLQGANVNIQIANQEAQKARNELRNMRLKKKGTFSEIQKIIQDSLGPIENNQQSIKEYLRTLGIKCLKDRATKEDINNRVIEIIQEHDEFKALAALIPNAKDKSKIQSRYDKYYLDAKKQGITLDGMAELNSKNKQIIDHFKSSYAENNTGLINELRKFEWFLNIGKQYGDDHINNIANLVKIFKDKTEKSSPNLLGEKHIRGRKYEKDLIYRAFQNLGAYIIENNLYPSLEELLLYQQKLDVITVC